MHVCSFAPHACPMQQATQLHPENAILSNLPHDSITAAVLRVCGQIRVPKSVSNSPFGRADAATAVAHLVFECVILMRVTSVMLHVVKHLK